MPFSSTHSFSNKHTIIKTSYISYSVINTLNIQRLYSKGFHWFAEEVVSINCTHYMTSFDTESLFSNIPSEETINICTENDFQNKTKVNNWTKNFFWFLLELSTFDSFFIFDGKYSKKENGVAMGFTLDPTLANVFSCHFEKQWMSDCLIDYKSISNIISTKLFQRHTFVIFVWIARRQVFKLHEL